MTTITTAQPRRIQRRRTKGWQMPEGAVYVGRPSRWANPWREGETAWTVLPGGRIDKTPRPPLTREQAVESFRNSWTSHLDWTAMVRSELAGRDLACWCPPGQPCHADVLLELANGADPTLPGAVTA
jgi:hypothetical protein